MTLSRSSSCVDSSMGHIVLFGGWSKEPVSTKPAPSWCPKLCGERTLFVRTGVVQSLLVMNALLM